MQIDLSVSRLVRKFGEFKAVDDVSFDVEMGSFFSIVGPAGCGKTTILRMIAGLLEPTRGSIEIRGRDMAGVAPDKRPVGMVYENLALFPKMNVAENIAFGLRRRGERGAEVGKKVEAVLESVGLAGYGNKEIQQLSAAQKQRVALARCLVLRPVVLLLDEPLGLLDLGLREHMKVEFKKLQAQVGTTFVCMTRDQSQALMMSDYVAVMKSGSFEQIGTPQRIYREPASPFVARFFGDNNLFLGRLGMDESGRVFLRTGDGGKYLVDPPDSADPGDFVEMFIRPEEMIVNPDESMRGINREDVVVKSVLFDGANNRLLVSRDRSTMEWLVALPRGRQYDAIKAKDLIRIGWHPSSAICFRAAGNQTYEEL